MRLTTCIVRRDGASLTTRPWRQVAAYNRLMGAEEAGNAIKPGKQRHPWSRRPAALLDRIQHDHRYLALGLELIVGVRRPKFERLFPKPEAFLARRCPCPRVHLPGPDLYFDVRVRQNIAIPPGVLGRASL